MCGSCSEDYLRWHPIASPLNLLPEQTCLTIIILSWNLLFLFHFEGSLGKRGGKICLVVDVKARRDERLHGCSVQYLGRTAQQPALALHPPPPRSCPSATLNRPPRCKGDHHHNRIHLHEVQLPASYSHLSFLLTPHCPGLLLSSSQVNINCTSTLSKDTLVWFPFSATALCAFPCQ